MRWLDQITISLNAYAYQASLLCEDCALQVANKLTRGGVVNDGDSNTFPQGPYEHGGGESDSANFCSSGKACKCSVEITRGHRVGCPINNPLTREGAQSVLESIVRDMFSKKKFSQKIGRLLCAVWGDYLDLPPVRAPASSTTDTPSSLLRLCKPHHSRHSGVKGFDSRIYADAGHAYLVYHKPLSVDLIRSHVNDDGEFEAFEVAEIPAEATKDISLDDLVRDAVSESAWE